MPLIKLGQHLCNLLESEQGSDVSVGRDPPEQIVVGHIDRPVWGRGDRLGREQPLSQGGPVASVGGGGAVDGPLLSVAHHRRHHLSSKWERVCTFVY